MRTQAAISIPKVTLSRPGVASSVAAFKYVAFYGNATAH